MLSNLRINVLRDIIINLPAHGKTGVRLCKIANTIRQNLFELELLLHVRFPDPVHAGLNGIGNRHEPHMNILPLKRFVFHNTRSAVYRKLCSTLTRGVLSRMPSHTSSPDAISFPSALKQRSTALAGLLSVRPAPGLLSIFIIHSSMISNASGVWSNSGSPGSTSVN